MSRSCCWLLKVLAISTVALTCACSNPSSPPISVKLSPSLAQKIDASQTVSITATVVNDASGKGISWVLTGPGSLSNSTGSLTTYTAPNVTTPQQVTVTAISQTDQTKRASVQITVSPYPDIPFQTLSFGTVGTSYSQTV